MMAQESVQHSDLVQPLEQKNQATADKLTCTGEILQRLLVFLQPYLQVKPGAKKGDKAVRQSLEILCSRLEVEIAACERASQELHRPLILVDANIDIDTDELLELVEEAERNTVKTVQTQLLRLLEVMDHLELLDAMEIPLPKSRRHQYSLYHQLRNKVREYHRDLKEHLTGIYNVRAITSSELLGTHPPLEITNIAFREDDSRSDNFVISKILKHGYLWNDIVLRKALVAVTAQQENK